jgi:hypothetical protein
MNSPTHSADEAELCKAQLLERRPELGAKMWNDQPWLDTMVVAGLFRVLGEHAAIPRILSLISVGVMMLGIGCLVRACGTAIESSLFPLFFLTAFPMPQLAMSAMLEVPAVACAAASLALLSKAEGAWARGKLVLSGCAFGAALQIKLTSAVLFGGVIVLLCCGKTLNAAARSFAVWCGAAFCAWGLIAWISPAFDLHTLVGSHLTAGRAMPEVARKVLAFSCVDLIRSPALCLAAGVGIARPWRRWDRGLFAVLALLAGAILFALLQRPWWQYYSIYLNLPMAVFAALGVGHLVRRCRDELSRLTKRELTQGAGGPVHAPAGGVMGGGMPVMIGAAVLSLWASFSVPELASEIRGVYHAPGIQNSAVGLAMREYANRSQWCYTTDRSYAFAAGVLIPPELIVLPYKRFWSGEADQPMILDAVKKYAPEELLLGRGTQLAQLRWQSWVHTNYVLVADDEGEEVWVARRLHPTPLVKADKDWLRHHGL